MSEQVTADGLPPDNMPKNGSELMKVFLPASPFVQELGVSLAEIEDGRAVLLLPFRPELATVGDMVHGAAIAGLMDITAMATSWAGAEIPEKLRGVTVSMSTEFINPAHNEDLLGEGKLLRRGASLCAVEMEVRSASDQGHVIAKGLATYKIG
ncbi:MAG: PaaI family thioesterase [Solirubrobacterales bacterium]|nr:PaaI family thioesterase [Solirubrobacterales bacterium]